ncbi:thioesterase II family protein [Nocardia fluminea]|uniref:thioesterase II family protein n=1 Tax=Nocardia fluminea TaxID=134984 RepID=UPI0037A47AA3
MADTRSADSLWIRRYREADDGVPQLICLPHAGGSAPYYLPMARAFAPRLEVMAIQYPGRQDRLREPGLKSVDDLADQIFPVLQRNVSDDFALFGHSLGATLAFELARRFDAVGVIPRVTFVSGRTAPSRHRFGCTVHLASAAGIVAEVRSLSGTDDQILDDPEVLAMALPALRSDYRAAETYDYRPGPPLACPIHAMIGDADPMVTEDEARAWRDHTTAPFALDVYRGGHFYLAAHADRIMRTIADRLSDRGPVDAD